MRAYKRGLHPRARKRARHQVRRHAWETGLEHSAPAIVEMAFAAFKDSFGKMVLPMPVGIAPTSCWVCGHRHMEGDECDPRPMGGDECGCTP